MINRIILVGRLTKSPELRYTQSGKAVCGFVLAVDRDFADANGNRQADFVNIVVWGAAGESCAKYLDKGKLAAVDGRLQLRNWTDKDGAKRYVTEVIAEKVRFLSPKDSGAAASGGAADNSAPAAATPAADEAQYGYYMGGEYAEDDLPF